MPPRALDFVVFGASGFTGKSCVAKAAKIFRGHPWGIAGRSRTLLESVLNQQQQLNVPVFVAEVEDYDSLLKMSANCRVLINCCGPFEMYGEPVVRACIDTGTDYVDVSAEPPFMEDMWRKYNRRAVERQVFSVNACGYDSVLCEMGLLFAERHFRGTIHSTEIFIKIRHQGPITDVTLNYGTWHSMVRLFSGQKQRPIREVQFPEPQQKFKIIHKSPVTNKWYVPFPNIDARVSERTQHYLMETRGKRPIQVCEYYDMGKTCFLSLLVVMWGCLTFLFSRFKLGARLLLAYPTIFSVGQVSRKGPPKQRYELATFRNRFYSTGWPEGDAVCGSPTHALITEVSGMNPAYGATSTCLLLSALTLIKERAKLPASGGGVITPGIAFRDTELLENLMSHGIDFRVVREVTKI